MTAHREKVLVCLAVQSVTAGGFALAQHMTSGVDCAPPAWLQLAVDRHLPFVPAFVWLYASWYIAPIVILATELSYFRRATAAIVVAFLACALGWLAVPGVMARPAVDCAAAPSLAALCAVYHLDPPSDLFPSFHAALAAIVARTPVGNAAVRLGLVGWMIAICVSCVLTKQHYVLDVVAGIAVGLGAMATADGAAAYLERRRAGLARRQSTSAVAATAISTASPHIDGPLPAP